MRSVTLSKPHPKGTNMHKAKTLVLALASLLGRWRGETLTLANAKGGHDWKAMHAEAIGLGAGKTDMPDDEQVAAHHKHMALVNSMDDEGDDFPAAMDNAKKDEATALLNTAVTEGRIAAEDCPAWCGKFGADFDAAKTELAAVKKPEPENEELANAKKQATAMRKEATDLLLGNAITSGKSPRPNARIGKPSSPLTSMGRRRPWPMRSRPSRSRLKPADSANARTTSSMQR